MKKLVECVPNFSEGRDRAVIDAIADAIRRTPGCTLLDVDPGRSTNRTVYTFVGPPDAVVEGALAGARVAHARIDMRAHQGEHARMGALDVCPFVPVSGVTLEECVALARDFGRRAAEELAIPVYLYEAAASQPHRRTLSQIRAGEYEGLAEKIARPDWQPDFGPARFLPGWGATVTGARHFLIAYNVNLLATKEQAHRIALDLREQGRGPQQPGRLRAVKAVGWWVEEYGMAQVSMNLDDFKVTPPHVAFEEVVKEARALKLAVAGSEIVGLVRSRPSSRPPTTTSRPKASSSWTRGRSSAWPRTAWAWAPFPRSCRASASSNTWWRETRTRRWPRHRSARSSARSGLALRRRAAGPLPPSSRPSAPRWARWWDG